MTTDINNCPQCNQPLAKDAPKGICANCLLKAALDPLDTTMVLDENDLNILSDNPVKPVVGSQFGNYQINGLLGAGGMGTVFDAEELNTGRRLALKVLSHGISSDDLKVIRGNTMR